MAKNITDDVKDVLLLHTEWSDDGKSVKLLQKGMDRKLYQGVNAVLEAAGGKWNRKAEAHLFPTPSREKVCAMVDGGKVMNERKEAGFFPTPQPLAQELVRLANVSPGMEVLEPSAGDGAIVAELLGAGAAFVVAVEFLEENREKLTTLFDGNDRFVLRLERRFEEMDPLAKFDRVVMNPPFDFECEHVAKALSMLKPGGKLVSVMSNGITFRSGKHATLREFILELGGTITDNPDKSLEDTNVKTVTVVVTMP